MRRIQVQAHDVPHLVDQQRIVGKLERFAAMGAQSERPPDAADRRLTQSRFGCQRATAPMRCSFWGLFQVSRTARSTRSSPICRGAPGRTSSPKAAIPLGDKAIPPHSHGEARGPQFSGYRSVVRSSGTFQNDAGAKGQRSRTARLLQQLPQVYLLFWTDNEFLLRRTSSWIRHDPR